VKKHYLLIGASLMASLFVYLFYRTEKTVINELVIRILTKENYLHIRSIVNHQLKLTPSMVYSLPEGLWVFCITLTSKRFYVPIFSKQVDGVWFPLVFATGLELLQLSGVTNGRFDILDIGFSIAFWLAGTFLIPSADEKQNFLKPINVKSTLCLASYGIVYLAHVLEG
jgi:hypothetical protein